MKFKTSWGETIHGADIIQPKYSNVALHIPISLPLGASNLKDVDIDNISTMPSYCTVEPTKDGKPTCHACEVGHHIHIYWRNSLQGNRPIASHKS